MLTLINKQPVKFDPKNKDHRASYVVFQKTGRWPVSARYFLEDPFNNVPSMVACRIAEFYLRKAKEWQDEQVDSSEQVVAAVVK